MEVVWPSDLQDVQEGYLRRAESKRMVCMKLPATTEMTRELSNETKGRTSTKWCIGSACCMRCSTNRAHVLHVLWPQSAGACHGQYKSCSNEPQEVLTDLQKLFLKTSPHIKTSKKDRQGKRSARNSYTAVHRLGKQKDVVQSILRTNSKVEIEK
ncbi:unnamed protein product [Peronospora belbahrii]|uniref:Uncharacterized protein n=1 Tax=Peronospora belbahrii TaxID=622444 RepID=A0ABN8D425_9STRA|nr:unnamed protein product [Peronospora belbahrii]